MIGARIKQLRKEKSLSQKAFADLLSTSSGYISEVESGKTMPGGNFFISLKRALDVDINWLLTGEGEKYIKEREGSAQAGSPIYNKVGNALDDDPAIAELMEMTRAVLKSDTDYSDSLATNVRSFFRALKTDKRLSDIEGRLDQVESIKNIADLKKENEDLKERLAALEKKMNAKIPQVAT